MFCRYEHCAGSEGSVAHTSFSLQFAQNVFYADQNADINKKEGARKHRTGPWCMMAYSAGNLAGYWQSPDD
jgi:hypothetical protein